MSIKAARAQAGMTQAELANAAGLPQSHISRLEAGQHSPSHVTREKLAAALGKSAADFEGNQSVQP